MQKFYFVCDTCEKRINKDDFCLSFDEYSKIIISGKTGLRRLSCDDRYFCSIKCFMKWLLFDDDILNDNWEITKEEAKEIYKQQIEILKKEATNE